MKVTDPTIKTTVALLETYYWKYSRIATDAELEREYLQDTCVTQVLSSPELVRYLVQQGVPVDGTPTLTPKQVRWIDTLCSSGAPINIKMKQAGVTQTQHNAWLKNPLFQSALTSRIEKILPDERNRVHSALAREASVGNVSAIKLYLTVTGELETNEGGNKSETAGLMQGILEILESHISPAILHALADDFDYLLVHGVVPLRRRNAGNAGNVTTQPKLLENVLEASDDVEG